MSVEDIIFLMRKDKVGLIAFDEGERFLIWWVSCER